MRRREHQSGFSTTVVLFAVLVVAVLAVAGFAVFQHNRTKGTSAAANTTQSTNPQTTTPQPTSPQPASATVTYLTIKEWGLKLPLSDPIKDAYYIPGISSKGTDGLPNQMWVGLKSLDGNGCTATNNSGPALIFRAQPTDTDPVSGELLTNKYPDGVTIGNYYYAYEDFTTGSGNTCKAPQVTLQAMHGALARAAKGTVKASAN